MRRSIDSSLGWQNRKFQDIDRQLRELRAAKTLRRSSFADVPAGAIPVSTLSERSGPGFVNLTATGFAVAATTGADVITNTVSVPTGYTRCVVSLTGRVYALNNTAGADFLYARVGVGGVTGNALPQRTTAGAAETNVATLTTVLEDLDDGGTFTVSLWAAALTGSWSSDAGNTADLTGVLLWTT